MARLAKISLRLSRRALRLVRIELRRTAVLWEGDDGEVAMHVPLDMCR